MDIESGHRLTAERIGVGIPDGVVYLVMGSGVAAGEARRIEDGITALLQTSNFRPNLLVTPESRLDELHAAMQQSIVERRSDRMAVVTYGVTPDTIGDVDHTMDTVGHVDGYIAVDSGENLSAIHSTHIPVKLEKYILSEVLAGRMHPDTVLAPIEAQLKPLPHLIQSVTNVHEFQGRMSMFPKDIGVLGWIDISDEWGEGAQRFLETTHAFRDVPVFSTTENVHMTDIIRDCVQSGRPVQILHRDGPINLTVRSMQNVMSDEQIRKSLYVVQIGSESVENIVDPAHVVHINKLQAVREPNALLEQMLISP